MGNSIDLEKVIKGIDICLNRFHCGADCPYYDNSGCQEQLREDALALLKEQETENTGRCRVFQCKKCGFGIDDIFVNDEEKFQIVPRYCPNCGRNVRQE